MLFLGHLHPVLVHLPIGGLVLLGFLEVVAGSTRWKQAAQNGPWILAFASAAAVASLTSGWLLGQTGNYDPRLLHWHRVLAFAVTGGALLTWGMRVRQYWRTYRVSLAALLVLLAVAGHLGGSLTHGSGFLTRGLPASLRAWLNPVAPSAPVAAQDLRPEQPVFESLIAPILRERCSGCHGPEKHKAGLRLDNLAGLLHGGQDGPVVKAGQASGSLLVQRLLLAVGEDGHMPPEGSAQPTPQEIALLAWWVDAGMPVAEKVGDPKVEPRLRSLLRAHLQETAANH